MISDGVILLRAPEPADIDALFRWENDRDGWRYAVVRAPMSRQALWEYVHNYNPDVLAAGELRMVIVDAGGGESVGAVDLYDVDALNRRGGVGIVVDTQLRGRGYGCRAVNLVADYARMELGLHQLWAVVGRDNAASRSMFEHCGFKIGGCMQSWIRMGESYMDAYFYQRLLVT